MIASCSMRIRADALLQAVVMQQAAVLARFDFRFHPFLAPKIDSFD
jgi:hypothetical protein